MASLPHDGFASAVDHFTHALVDTAARSLVFLALVLLVVLALRRASAATRHWAWLAGFVGLLLLPLTYAAVPGWRVLPRIGLASPAVAGPVGRTSDSDAKLPPQGTTDQPEGHSSAAAGPVLTAASRVGPLPAARQATVDPQPAAARPAAPAWTIWITSAWLLGTGLVLGRLAVGHGRLWRLQRRCTSVDGEWRDQLDRLCRRVGVERRVDLLAMEGDVMPMTWGVCRAKLLLPTAAANWEPSRREDVLLHELGHVRRFDCATQLVAQIACAAYWFNPLVWVAWHRLQVERERACDDIVLGSGSTASTYARHLLQSAAVGPRRRFLTPALAMARPSTLEARLNAILDASRNRGTLSAWGRWTMLGVLLAALLPVAVLHAQQTRPTATAATRPAETASRGRGATTRMVGDAPPVMGQGPTCAFAATVYEVRVPSDKIGLIDTAALTAAAATPAGFEKALAELGTSRPLYHTGQAVRLASDTIMIATQVPIVTNSQTTAAGHVIRNIRYQSTGAAFSIAGKSDGPDKVQCDLKIELSVIASHTAGGATTAPTGASVFHTTTLSHKGAVRANQPFVILSADAANADDSGKAVVYIAKVALGTPE